MRKLSEIKVGDRVWVEAKFNTRRIQPVARLTPKLIILDGVYSGGAKSEFNRYHRGKPSPYGDHEPSYWQYGGTGGSCIERIATKAECDQWDAEQEAQAQKQAEAKRAAEARESLRTELVGLFPEGYYIQETYHNSAGEWQVYVYTTEQGVRNLAAMIKANMV